jgi:tetratricopeptide (TPR) repeat protein
VKYLAFVFLFSCVLVWAAPAPVGQQQSILIIPFDNQSRAPGLEWIAEAFPEVLGERLRSGALEPASREERIQAFDHFGLPANVQPSRATLFRIAEQMGVDYLVLGSYSYDGQNFSAKAELLDVKREHLLPSVSESGLLTHLLEIQNALAWDLLRQLQPQVETAKETFLLASAPVRLDAFENYIRGITDAEPRDRVRHFREALRLNPNYTQAMLALGKTYYSMRQYEFAVLWLNRVPRSDREANQASFYLGMAAFYHGDYDRAESAFRFLASRTPLPEIYNNLGVVETRRGKPASEYFHRAVQDDPNDPDYRFNMAVALCRAGDNAGAARQLRDALSLRSSDSEASALLESLGHASPGSPGQSPAVKLPMERIKIKYNESAFRQVARELQNVAEEKLVATDPRSHARFHVNRGTAFLGQGFTADAEREFREATTLDPNNAEAHLGLAKSVELTNPARARDEAEMALRLQPSTEALLVLARLDLRDNKLEEAAQKVDRALEMEPSNALAQPLKRTVAAKLAEKAQPLHN